ncbi:MAG: dihydrofolate reductase [Actinobacteria bacterium]|nr:dihydrofolate reductase [Actinomycetota bacterium]
MRKVTYSMGMTLDGFITDPAGSIDWSVPDDEVFRHSIEEIRSVGVHLMGRKLYETMRYWEDPDNAASFDASEQEWAGLWNPLPKVVFSRTLTEVEGAARLASGTLAEEIEALRAEPGDGDIAIGGATLAAEAHSLGLVDEYLIRVFPVVVGGGTPFFPRDEQQVDLELIDTRTFPSGIVFVHYRTKR